MKILVRLGEPLDSRGRRPFQVCILSRLCTVVIDGRAEEADQYLPADGEDRATLFDIDIDKYRIETDGRTGSRSATTPDRARRRLSPKEGSYCGRPEEINSSSQKLLDRLDEYRN